MSQKHYYVGLIMVTIILILMGMTSCTPYGKGCDGNRKMLTAGAGYTKFRK